MEQKKEVVISETSRIQQMWGWWRAKLDMAAKSPWYASYLLRRFYDLMKALKPSKQLVASTVTGAALLVGSMALNPAPAQAANITVNSTGEAVANDGVCTLREALTAANTNTASGALPGECAAGGIGSDTIDLTGVSGTITLGSSLPPISTAGESIVLNGPGAANLTIDGGGTSSTIISNNYGNDITINGLTIKNSSGDGVFAYGNATVTNSTISGNNGRGVQSRWINVSVSNSTISGNASMGVYATISNVTVTNSTISGNGSLGVFARYGDINVSNSTISGNGNTGVTASYTVINLKNNLIVGNTGNDVNCAYATLTSNGHNLIETQNACVTFLPVEITTALTPTIFGPLQDNGGSTFTHALVKGSPALDKGLNNDAPGATDQRGTGFARISNTTIDIGAFEFQVAAAVGGVAELITPPAVNDGLMWRVVGLMGAGLATGLGVLGLSRAKKTE